MRAMFSGGTGKNEVQVALRFQLAVYLQNASAQGLDPISAAFVLARYALRLQKELGEALFEALVEIALGVFGSPNQHAIEAHVNRMVAAEDKCAKAAAQHFTPSRPTDSQDEPATSQHPLPLNQESASRHDSSQEAASPLKRGHMSERARLPEDDDVPLFGSPLH